MKPAKRICIYHKNCLDGFTAAWVVTQYFGADNVELIPRGYDDEPIDIARLTDRDVFIVDFSFKRDVMREIIGAAYSTVVLDHHKTAEEELRGLQEEFPDRAYIVFDMRRSGAKITWDYFYPETEAPLTLQCVQDRDLWLFRLPSTKQVTAALVSYPMRLSFWTEFMSESGWSRLIDEGTALLRKQHHDVEAVLKTTRMRVQFGKHVVPAANMPFTMASDAGNIMAQGNPFAVVWGISKGGDIAVSLRSSDEGEDVSEIAKLFGGGGHRNAAGFKVKKGDKGAFMDFYILLDALTTEVSSEPAT